MYIHIYIYIFCFQDSVIQRTGRVTSWWDAHGKNKSLAAQVTFRCKCKLLIFLCCSGYLSCIVTPSVFKCKCYAYDSHHHFLCLSGQSLWAGPYRNSVRYETTSNAIPQASRTN